MEQDIKQNKNWKVLEFFVPIQETFVDDDKTFFIKGVAINETTTLNNVKYVAEELEMAAPSFRNVPILLDHKNEVKNIVGRTTEKVLWNPQMRRIEFEGKIMDKDIQEMIRDGRIGSVSIGAQVQNLTEEEDGSMKAIGVRGLELSLVAVPGDLHANLAQALQESFSLKKQTESSAEIIKPEDEKMSEDEKVDTEDSKTEEAEETEEVKEEPTTETAEKVKQEINVKVDTSEVAEMRKQLDELKEILMAKKVKESEESEEVAEDETKGEVTEEEVAEEKADGEVVVEQVGNKVALYRDYSKETSNLKRLVR